MSQVKSKQRVADHGEVFTPEWMVEAMLDLVKAETERIDSRFLEPACGSGNFLVKILGRKLAAVEFKFGKSDFEKRHYALLPLMCTYGIELLEDNIAECRLNMLDILVEFLNLDESDPDSATAQIHAWNPRKQKVFKPTHIRTAWNRLVEQGLLKEQSKLISAELVQY